MHKTERKFQLIEIAVPGDKRDEMKEKEEIENYSDLKRDAKKIRNISQLAMVPIVVGALGVTSKKFNNWLKKLGVKSRTELLQKTALLGTARIIKQVLET